MFKVKSFKVSDEIIYPKDKQNVKSITTFMLASIEQSQAKEDLPYGPMAWYHPCHDVRFTRGEIAQQKLYGVFKAATNGLGPFIHAHLHQIGQKHSFQLSLHRNNKH